MKRALINPFNEDRYMHNRFFDGPCKPLKELFAERGYQIDTMDMGDLTTADLVLSFNHYDAFYRRCKEAGLSRDKLALFVFEPRVVMPQQYDAGVWDSYGHVFSFLETKTDGSHVFPLRYPQHQALAEAVPEFAERKGHLVLINANKYSYIDNELYSLRRRAIRHFEKRPGAFDLYGFEWDKGNKAINRMEALKYGGRVRYMRDIWEARRPYSSYRGSVTDKHETLTRYKFALCFENEKEAPGYITEKIFDCLIAGTIPIYLGAPNITDYFPAEAIIDMRQFRDFEALERYLDGVTPDEGERMQRAGQDYLQSEQFAEWRPRPVLKTFVDVLAPEEA